MTSFFKCNSWIYLMLLKCKKIKKIYKEDMNKGTLRSFCLKIFLCINAGLKHCPHIMLYRVKIFRIHVNILYDTTISNKSNLTSAVPQFIQLHFLLLLYVNAVQVNVHCQVIKIDKCNTMRPGNLFVGDDEG